MSSSRKRPRTHSGRDNAAFFPHEDQQEIQHSPLDACVQGYEATLTYDQEAFAKSLRLPEDRGGQLMRWIGSKEAETDLDGNSMEGREGKKQDVWIDRCGFFLCALLVFDEETLVEVFCYGIRCSAQGEG